MNKAMFASYRFQFRLILTMVVGVCLVILVWLGVWQVQRLSWKQHLIQKIEARLDTPEISLSDAVDRWRAGEDMEYTPVTVRGTFDFHNTAYIFGTLNGVAGQYVFTPLNIRVLNKTSAEIVYVNRGFAPQAFIDELAENVIPQTGAPPIRGLFRTAEQRVGMAKVFQPVDQPEKNQFYTRDPHLFAANAGLSAPSFYIDSFAVVGEVWPRGGTTRVNFRNNHLDYALTWFGLAGVLLAMWLVLSIKKITNNK